MSNKEYKVIKENWDQFVNEEGEEQINEIQLPGMNFVLENLNHLADFFDYLAKVTNQPKIKEAADACRVVDAGLKNLEKNNPVVYKMLQAGDIVGALKGRAANKAITAIRNAFGVGSEEPKQIPQEES